MTRIALIGCSKTKLDVAAPARDLYISPLFRLSRAWAEKHADRWYILSAQHGLVSPDAVLVPYDARMPSTKDRRFWWGKLVQDELMAVTQPGDELLFMAGQKYRGAVFALPDRRVLYPLGTLEIGQRLHWLKEHV